MVARNLFDDLQIYDLAVRQIYDMVARHIFEDVDLGDDDFWS